MFVGSSGAEPDTKAKTEAEARDIEEHHSQSGSPRRREVADGHADPVPFQWRTGGSLQVADDILSPNVQ
jgi:hypothetical protein